MKRRLALVAFVLGLACASRATPPAESNASRTPTTPREPRAIPDDVLASVDGFEIRKSHVDIAYAQLLRDRLEGGSGRAPRREEKNREDVLARLIYSELLRLECDERGLTDKVILRRMLPEFVDDPKAMAQITTVIDDLRETALADAMGLFEITEDELVAEYERQKSEWTGAQPWLVLEMAYAGWLDPTGVEACDRYIVQLRRCIDERMPEIARPVMTDALEDSALVRAQMAKGPEAASLTASCTVAREAAQQATEPHGCAWPADEKVDVNAFGKSSARKLAGRMRERMSEAGADFAAEAEALGLRRSVMWGPVQSDSLPRRLAVAVPKLKVGAVTRPIEHDGAFWLVQLVRRLPPGTLPFEERRAGLEREMSMLRNRFLRAELEARLRATHRVDVTPTR